MIRSVLDRRWSRLWLFLIALHCLITPALMVKHENFKTCDQSGFCKRNREYADVAVAQGKLWSSPYRIDTQTLKVKDGTLTATLLKTVDDLELVHLPLVITFLKSGAVRVTVDEAKRESKEIELRHGSQARKERYNEASKWAIVGDLTGTDVQIVRRDEKGTTIQYGPGMKYQAVIRHSPFSVDFIRDEQVHVKLNGEGLMNMEHWRPKVEKEKKEAKDGETAEQEQVLEDAADESTWWEETFGGNTDSKPKGPESVGLDITFPGYEHVFGIPEHTGPLSLKETRGGPGNYDQPYRLYNSDVFEYELNSPMTLYGSIPFMHAHRKDSTVGVFWLNAAETWIDIVKSRSSSNPLSLGVGGKTDTRTHWFSESGLLDVFVFLGPSSRDVMQVYSDLTGPSQLPQHFAIAYHQCRWNYVTDEDVKDVDRKFDKYSIPYDVIWLDIEYTDGKKYFTWDAHTFADPIGMQKQLESHGRKLVAIIDPHIKNEAAYPIVDELKSKNLAVRNKDGNIYEGWCWPGSSHWVDAFSPAAVKWWQGLFSYSAFKGSAPNTFIWNDMNEPSVFNGPETTMPKDNLHHGDWEHRDVHNLNGMTFANATYNALIHRDPKSPRRPFVLTRSFFAGSQRSAAVWTGDNEAKWDHLAASIPMILANNIAGYPFVGADVGGFFGNPSKELLTRWYQAGTFYPFFRGHAHIDTRRREPYLAGEPYTRIITQALRLRYQLLPAWYTAFHGAATDGSPIVRPQYYIHPSDERGFAIDDQFYVGETGLLAKPVTAEGAEEVHIYIADDELYFDYFDYKIVQGKGKSHKLQAPLDKIPLLMQGGHVIPRRDRPRRSSALMKWDPFTLVVVIGKNGTAEGTLYVDDGESFNYQEGAYIHRKFTFSSATGSLVSADLATAGKKTKEYLKSMTAVKVEKIVIVSAPACWASKDEVYVAEDGTKEARKVALSWHSAEDGKAAWAVVRDPGVAVGKHFSTPLYFASKHFSLNATLIPFPSGTGHMIASLRADEIDIGIGLTEGWVAGLGKAVSKEDDGKVDGGYRILGTYVDTPLCWAISTGRDRELNDMDALKGGKVGVSRIGSGSYVMSFVLADTKGWLETPGIVPFEVIPLQTFTKLREAVNDKTADFFMWEHFTSKKYYDNGDIKRIGEIYTPWSSWKIVARNAEDERLSGMFESLNKGIRYFEEHHDEAVEYISTELDYSKEDATEWLQTIRFSRSVEGVSEKMIEHTIGVLKKAGVLGDDAMTAGDMIGTSGNRCSV